MTTVAPDRQQAVQRALAAVARIATLPLVATQVIALVEDPNSKNAELVEIIEQDPVLAAKVLKVANSPMYGFAQKIGSVRRAVDMLGHGATRNITIAASMAKLFRGVALAPGVTAEQVWEHSRIVAILARALAEHVDHPSPEEAYLAGLLHEIGTMLEALVDKAALERAICRFHARHSQHLWQAESELLGADHQDFGGALCRAWKLPAGVCDAVAHHHTFEAAPCDSRVLAAIVAVADAAAATLPSGAPFDRADQDPAALALLALDEAHVASITEVVAQTLSGSA